MALRFVLDEHLRGTLMRAILRHNAAGDLPIDIVEVGALQGLPLGVSDESLLEWAAREGRILVTRDRSTMPGHLNAHLSAGHRSPGVFVIGHSSIRSIVAYLAAAAHASEPGEWQDRVNFVPDEF